MFTRDRICVQLKLWHYVLNRWALNLDFHWYRQLKWKYKLQSWHRANIDLTVCKYDECKDNDAIVLENCKQINCFFELIAKLAYGEWNKKWSGFFVG